MLKKLLSSIGMGSAKVDTKLYKTNFIPGELLEGIVEIQGGQVEQRIDEVYLSVFCNYTIESDDGNHENDAVLGKYKLLDSFVINPNESKSIPFSISIPNDVPITTGKTNVWLQTGLDISMSIDPQDRDYIEIQPHPLVNAFLLSVKSLGFRLRKTEAKKAPGYLRGRLPFAQEFEFVPTSGPFRGRLDELEAVFFISEDRVDAIIQVDKKGGYLAEMFDMDESHVRFSYGTSDVPRLKELLNELINKYS
ncbi:sporulation protein [Peribacillus sp. NPDC097295]|uniref:sporulation protein n=1 Tax=Peribacillus sp. NPDC097295 TaxID=3364402 RepID=UPI00380F228B